MKAASAGLRKARDLICYDQIVGEAQRPLVGVMVMVALGLAHGRAQAEVPPRVIGSGGTAQSAVPAADELSVADLKWPASTRSAVARWSAHVDDAAGGRKIGELVRGARVAWRRIVAAHDACGAWLELEPRGWTCAHDLAPSDDAAPAATPVVIADDAPSERYADIKKEGALAYDSLDDARTGVIARVVPDKTFVAVRANARSVTIDGVRYWKTDQGWIANGSLTWYSPSEFAGIDLAASPPASWPFAWVVPHVHGAKVVVRDAADPHGAPVRELRAREIVSVLETSGAWTRIGTGEWIEQRDLRVANRSSRPDGVADGEKWIDVDLDQQVLIAYEGDTPVFATMVSTGRTNWETPTGIYRVTGKSARTRMQDPGNMAEEWNVADVPWTMRFRKNFALHGTYWHDGFGRARSHGCVNLSTRDAHHLYVWTTPSVPDGWSEADDGGAPTGTPVRVRNAHDPDPVWKGYDGKPLAR
jgi:lipoprotein-anchoring transpeptidase ErfK/SrfK